MFFLPPMHPYGLKILPKYVLILLSPLYPYNCCRFGAFSISYLQTDLFYAVFSSPLLRVTLTTIAHTAAFDVTCKSEFIITLWIKLIDF